MKIASVFKSVTVAFSMYSRIPMPRFRWETEDMRYHLCFFPWVGGVIGILECLWFLGVARFEIGPTAATLIALSIPILVRKRRKPGWPERNRIPRLEELRASFCCKEGFASPG